VNDVFHFPAARGAPLENEKLGGAMWRFCP